MEQFKTKHNLKLISYDLCPFVQRARIVLEEKNVPYQIEFIDLDAPPEWFVDISPLEKVPVLLVDNDPLFESTVICEYIDEVTEGQLHPKDPFKKAQNRAWIEFCNNLLSATFTLYSTQHEIEFKQKKAQIIEWFDILEEQLTEPPFFNGSDQPFSLVDACFAPLFRYYQHFGTRLNEEIFSDTPKIINWSTALLQRNSVINSIPTDYAHSMDAFLQRKNSILTRQI